MNLRSKPKENISLNLKEQTADVSADLSNELKDLLNDLDRLPVVEEQNVLNDSFFSAVQNYEINYSVKDMVLIYEYYYEAKPKTTMRKIDLIHAIVIFECSPENTEKVTTRIELWTTMHFLKSDKFMRRFVLW